MRSYPNIKWKKLGSFFFERRRLIGKSAEDISLILGKSRVSITNMELGRQRIALDEIYLLAKAYKVSVQKIVVFFK